MRTGAARARLPATGVLSERFPCRRGHPGRSFHAGEGGQQPAEKGPSPAMQTGSGSQARRRAARNHAGAISLDAPAHAAGHERGRCAVSVTKRRAAQAGATRHAATPPRRHTATPPHRAGLADARDPATPTKGRLPQIMTLAARMLSAAASLHAARRCSDSAAAVGPFA